MGDERLNVDDLLKESLNEGEERERFVEEPRPTPTGGYQPLILARRKEIEELDRKMESFRETGAYVRKAKDGSEYVDYLAFQEDQARVLKLDREIRDFERRERQLADERQQRNRTASEVARAVMKRELSRLPENVRRGAAEAFVHLVQSLTSNGEWTKPVYVDRSKMEEALMQVVDTAVGNAMRRGWSGKTPTGSPDAPEPPRESEEPEEDDFTNNLMYAYERRQRRSMTVAEAKAAARAEAEKGKTA